MPTWKPHLRLTMSGTLGTSGEIFSCSLSLEPNAGTWQDIVLTVLDHSSFGPFMGMVEADGWEDMVADVVNFWARPASDICAHARLKMVKLAAIGPDGLYAAAPLEAARDVPGANAEAAWAPPFQISRKVTLETDGDLGRIKGGFYLPAPATLGGGNFDSGSGLWAIVSTEAVRGSVVQLLNDLANEPGLDAHDIRPVVASSGRHNKNGTVRLGPTNPEIKRVNIGRRPDVIRRRANKTSEARLADAAVSF